MTVHNPANLTDEQVVTQNGWRLLTDVEVNGTYPHASEVQRLSGGNWRASPVRVGLCSQLPAENSYRTKAPLPNPLFADLVPVNNRDQDWSNFVDFRKNVLGYATNYLAGSLIAEKFCGSVNDKTTIMMIGLIYGLDYLPEPLRAPMGALLTAFNTWARQFEEPARATAHTRLCHTLASL